ncbi:MAG: hypothetical protein ACXWLJ_06385 [Rhizomicrobium sp.]
MAKTLEQRIAQLEKMLSDFFTGGSPKVKKPRKSAAKAKKPKTKKKIKRRSSPRSSGR